MVSIQVDNTCLTKDLGAFIEPVEIHDSQGKLLGLFVPANLERGKQLYDETLAKIDWAAVERRRQDSRPGEPLARTLQILKELGQEIERRQTAGQPAFSDEEALTRFRALRQQAQGTNGTAKTTLPWKITA